MAYDDAVAVLERLTNFEHSRDPEAMRAVRLTRMQQLCRALGEPQRMF